MLPIRRILLNRTAFSQARPHASVIPPLLHQRRTLFDNLFNKSSTAKKDGGSESSSSSSSKSDSETQWIRQQLTQEMQSIMQEAQTQMMSKDGAQKNPMELMQRMQGVLSELEKTLNDEEKKQLDSMKSMLMQGMGEAAKRFGK